VPRAARREPDQSGRADRDAAQPRDRTGVHFPDARRIHGADPVRERPDHGGQDQGRGSGHEEHERNQHVNAST
jgi:hypothetical protein